MGIKVGGGKGFVNVGGGEGLQISPAPSRAPDMPVFNDLAKGHNQPFRHDQFRLGLFKVVEEHENHLTCRGYDPNGMSKGKQTVNVAKPWLLLQTEWNKEDRREKDKEESVTIGDLEITYEYDEEEIGKRVAKATIKGKEVKETQLITPNYFEDDMLVCVQCRDNGLYDGIPASVAEQEGIGEWDTFPASQVPGGKDARLTWVDLNVSGRCWAVDLSN